MLSFKHSQKILQRYKIKFADFSVAKSESEAVGAAKNIGYPVVLKLLSPQIVHKTEKGCVRTDIRNDSELVRAFDEIMKRAGKVKFEGMLVQKQLSGAEIIIGGKKDAQFGPIVLFGLGGIFVEVMKDFSMRVAPITKKEAIDMIHEIKGYPLLFGARGRKPVNEEKLADAILAVSKLMCREKLDELDLNPCFVDERSCIAADVRMV